MLPLSDNEFCERLQALSPIPLQVRWHENRSLFVKATRKRNHLELSLHRLFTYSSTPVLQAIIRFATSRETRSRTILRQMAQLYFTEIQPPEPNWQLMDPEGEHRDLKAIYDLQNQLYFQNQIAVPIAWFKVPHYSHFRHITFGVFDYSLPLIRINGLLDRPEVPLPFVEFIVYHEMLHAACPAKVDMRRRWRVHTQEFRRREALHAHYLFSKQWQKNARQILKSRNYVRTQ